MLKKFANYLYLFLSQYRFFWLLKEKKDKSIFNIKKLVFYVKRSISNKIETKEAYSTFAKWSFIQTISIIFITYILQIINPYIDYWIKALLYDYLKPDNVVFKLNLISNSEYVTFLTAIAAIGGVFIALYFSSLSAINATLYSTFSKDLRDLLYRDKISDSYIKILSFTTFFAFTLIGFFLLGFEKIYIAIPIILVLIGFIIFSYYVMGNRMHELLSTDALSHSIFRNLYKYIDNAIKNDIYNQDKTFQNHYFSLASQEIKLLTTLIDTSLENYKTHNTSFQYITVNIFRLLTYYQSKKRLIPHDSLWYRQRYEYKDLYKMGNFSNLNIFLQNGMMPQGENKSDLFWIEDRIIDYIIKILVNKIKNDEIEDFQNLLMYLLNYLKILVKYGNVKYAINIMKQLKDEIHSNDSIEKSKLVLLTDYTYSLPVEIILEFIKNIEIYSYESVSSIVNNNDMSSNFVKSKFNENQSETLNWLQEKLILEIEAEGREISHKWYQIEILMLTISRVFIENIETINELLENFFDSNFKDKYIQIYSTLLNRKWECINKYIINFHSIESILNDYLEKRKIKDLDWKEFSIEAFNATNRKLKKNCIVEIGDALNLVEEREDNNSPDIKGFFLQVTSENFIELIIEKDYENLINIYPKFFISSMIKYYDLKPNFDLSQLDYRKENELIWSFLPILNLLEITGLIKIMLEFNEEKETWNLIENYWLKLLQDDEKFISIGFIKLVISMTDSSRGVAPGFDQRFNWNRKIKTYLESKIDKDTFTKNYGGISTISHQEIIRLHDNVLIREYIGNDRTSDDVDGISIFIYTILTKNFKEANLNFQWPRDQEDFESSLKRNKEIYEEYKNARKKS